MKDAESCANANYLNYVKSVCPKTKEVRSLLRAFLVGGIICCIGQGVRFVLETFLGLSGDELAGYVSMAMIFTGAFLTGLGVYDRIGKFAGGGSIVPITGFANSIVSSAMEFRSEGLILGMGAKLFSVAGPVLVYGISASVLAGIIYLIIG